MENMHGGPCFDSSKREFDNLADFLGMDDLLNFSNDDIAGPILGPSFSLTDICIPSCEDVAELEWLSNFVDEESFNYSSFSGQEDSKAAEDYNTSRSITTTNTTSPSPSPSPSSSSSSLTSSSASLGNMAMAMTMAGNSNSSSSSSNNNSNTNDGSLQVQTGFPVPGRARSKRPRKEGSASGWVSSSSRSRLTTLSHPEPSSLSHDQPDYYNGEDSTITFLDCSSTSTMAAEATPFLIHFKSSPNTSTKTHQPTQSPPLPKKVNIKLWHNKTNQPISPTSTNSSSSTTTTATATTAGATTTNSYNNNNNNNSTTGEGGQEGQGRKCLHCGSQKTPQWRAGPLGPKTLCNACGVRHKSGRLFPEYRPVASPTFVASVHSNSHRKVMEIRGLKQRTYYHHNVAITTGAITSCTTTATTTTTGTIGTTTCSAPSYSFPSF